MRIDPALLHGPLAELRRDALGILAAGVATVDAEAAVRRALPAALGQIDPFRDVIVLALGKAAVPMARGAAGVLGERATGGLVVTKDGHAEGGAPPFEVREAAHPVPDARSVAAGEELLARAAAVDPRDLVLVLLSGGASALAEAPVAGATLDGIARATAQMLASGATIAEINARRRALSRLKGGGLARAVRGPLLTLAVSDVAGDDPAVIGSGPTWEPGRPERMRIVARLEDALAACAAEAARRGYAVAWGAERIAGEARAVPERLLAELAAADADGVDRRALIAGGEPVVRLCARPGTGGRNQELAVAAMPALAGRGAMVLAALGTDGTDGPTDAAGGLVDSNSLGRAEALGMSVRDHLERNDAGTLLEATNDLIVTGPTGTNVGDVVVVLIARTAA